MYLEVSMEAREAWLSSNISSRFTVYLGKCEGTIGERTRVMGIRGFNGRVEETDCNELESELPSTWYPA